MKAFMLDGVLCEEAVKVGFVASIWSLFTSRSLKNRCRNAKVIQTPEDIDLVFSTRDTSLRDVTRYWLDFNRFNGIPLIMFEDHHDIVVQAKNLLHLCGQYEVDTIVVNDLQLRLEMIKEKERKWQSYGLKILTKDQKSMCSLKIELSDKE